MANEIAEECRPGSSASFHDDIDRSSNILELGDNKSSCLDEASYSDAISSD